MIQKFLIVEYVVWVVGVVVDVVLRDGIDLNIAARKFQSCCLDKTILRTTGCTVSRIVWDSSQWCGTGDRNYLSAFSC